MKKKLLIILSLFFSQLLLAQTVDLSGIAVNPNDIPSNNGLLVQESKTDSIINGYNVICSEATYVFTSNNHEFFLKATISNFELELGGGVLEPCNFETVFEYYHNSDKIWERQNEGAINNCIIPESGTNLALLFQLENYDYLNYQLIDNQNNIKSEDSLILNYFTSKNGQFLGIEKKEPSSFNLEIVDLSSNTSFVKTFPSNFPIFTLDISDDLSNNLAIVNKTVYAFGNNGNDIWAKEYTKYPYYLSVSNDKNTAIIICKDGSFEIVDNASGQVGYENETILPDPNSYIFYRAAFVENSNYISLLNYTKNEQSKHTIIDSNGQIITTFLFDSFYDTEFSLKLQNNIIEVYYDNELVFSQNLN